MKAPSQPSPTNLSDELTAVLLDLSEKFNGYGTRLSPEHTFILNAKAAITAAYAEAIRRSKPDGYDNYTGTAMEDYQRGHNAAIDTFTTNLQKEGLLPTNGSDGGAE